MLEGPLLCEWREIMRRRLDLGLFAALGAALLLTGAAVWPAVTLAGARGDASAAVYQATGYGPLNGSGGPSWSGNNYAGSGIGAWSGAAYLNATGWGPAGNGYPAGGYGWYSAAGYSYPSYGSAGYLYYPLGTNSGYGSGAPAYGSSGYGTTYDSGGVYYVPNNGGYYAPPLLCGYGGSC
jgi:hypothetical protein